GAYDLLLHPELDISVSHDGLPEIHDAHRKDRKGQGTSETVERTIRELVACEKKFRVVMVVRPDTVSRMPEGINHLHALGVQSIDLTLDVWAHWSESEIASLERNVRGCAQIWRADLRDLRINWFDEKLAGFLPDKVNGSARCGFGKGEIAVAPSGNLYPCERLIGEDGKHNGMRLPGHVMEGEDFLDGLGPTHFRHEGCATCLMQECCNTTCKCNNFVRTGDPNRPDRLLCVLNKTCLEEVSKVVSKSLDVQFVN
ncbi:MAG: SPASM domain-containing protein, partial [Candidatus Omnitrophica bacterium]|nr:SPASM domain-containing protein [Candidatus Omnitrophota bacterium]